MQYSWAAGHRPFSRRPIERRGCVYSFLKCCLRLCRSAGPELLSSAPGAKPLHMAASREWPGLRPVPNTRHEYYNPLSDLREVIRCVITHGYFAELKHLLLYGDLWTRNDGRGAETSGKVRFAMNSSSLQLVAGRCG